MKVFCSKMIKVFVSLFFIAAATAPTAGCLRYSAEHPEKNHAQYLKDKSFCDNRARESMQELRDQNSYQEEFNQARQCMKGLGWKYRFRMGGAPETAETKSE